MSVANEDTVTTVLHNTLVTRVLHTGIVPGFTPDLFRVSREPKVYSYDAESLDKMPDLFFHLISDRKVAFPDQDGVYAECKPIKAGRSIGQHYCDAGLWRFIKGEYAWTMREGIMVGYVSSGHALPDDLSRFLTKKDRPTRMPLVSGPTAIRGAMPNVHCQIPHSSVHRRNFKYRETGEDAPDIAIQHVWLMCL